MGGSRLEISQAEKSLKFHKNDSNSQRLFTSLLGTCDFATFLVHIGKALRHGKRCYSCLGHIFSLCLTAFPFTLLSFHSYCFASSYVIATVSENEKNGARTPKSEDYNNKLYMFYLDYSFKLVLQVNW